MKFTLFTMLLFLLLGIGAHPQSEIPWKHPSRGNEPFSSLFTAPSSPYGAGHRGIDFEIPREQMLVSPVNGVIHFTGSVADRKLVTIRVDERTLLTLEPVESMLSAGDTINRGEELGTVAAGGHCGLKCVHIGVRVDNEYVNPLRFFMEKPVLLPAGQR